MMIWWLRRCDSTIRTDDAVTCAGSDNGAVTSSRYVRPGWFSRHVFNPGVALLTRAGVSVWGSRVLRVRGRKSGEVRETPVNLLTVDGARYLVAPRGWGFPRCEIRDGGGSPEGY